MVAVTGDYGSKIDPKTIGCNICRSMVACRGGRCPESANGGIGRRTFGYHENIAASLAEIRNGVCTGIHIEGINTQATSHGIVTPGAGKRICRTITDERIAKRIAVQVECDCILESSVLDIIGKRVAAACCGNGDLDQICAGICGLDNQITGMIDHIGVVTLASDQRIGTSASVKNIRFGITGEHIGKSIAGEIECN